MSGDGCSTEHTTSIVTCGGSYRGLVVVFRECWCGICLEWQLHPPKWASSLLTYQKHIDEQVMTVFENLKCGGIRGICIRVSMHVHTHPRPHPKTYLWDAYVYVHGPIEMNACICIVSFVAFMTAWCLKYIYVLSRYDVRICCVHTYICIQQWKEHGTHQWVEKIDCRNINLRFGRLRNMIDAIISRSATISSPSLGGFGYQGPIMNLS